MSSDPYIDSLRNEIAELKAQNEMLRSKLLTNYELKMRAVRDLIDAMSVISEM